MNGLKHTHNYNGKDLHLDSKFEIGGGGKIKVMIQIDPSKGPWASHVAEFAQRMQDEVGGDQQLKDMTPQEVHAWWGKYIDALKADWESMAPKVATFPS